MVANIHFSTWLFVIYYCCTSHRDCVLCKCLCFRAQSFVSERSIDQDLGCVDRFSCKLDDMIQSLQSFGSGS